MNVWRYALPRFLMFDTSNLIGISIDEEDRQPTGSTYTLQDPDGSKVIDAAAADNAVGGATFKVKATHLENESEGMAYLETWVLTFSATDVRTFRREVIVCVAEPHQVITDADLEAVARTLGAELPTGEDWSEQRGEAWNHLLAWLINKGWNPAAIRNLAALRLAHCYWALELIAAELDTLTAGPGKWGKRLREFKEYRRKELSELQLHVDTDGDGMPDSNRAARPQVYLSNRPNWTPGAY